MKIQLYRFQSGWQPRTWANSWGEYRPLRWYEKGLAFVLTPLIVMSFIGFVFFMLSVGMCYLVFRGLCSWIAGWRRATW